jgi:predicted membrane protein
MPYIFLGLAVLIAALILGRFLARVETHFMASVFKGIAAAVLVGAGILSILMGRWPIVFIALVFAALLFMPRPKRKTASRSKRPMTVKEACEILDLEIRSLTAKNINESYHRLMKKNHPDQGGSAYFARQLNEARELLLNEIEKRKKT